LEISWICSGADINQIWQSRRNAIDYTMRSKTGREKRSKLKIQVDEVFVSAVLAMIFGKNFGESLGQFQLLRAGFLVGAATLISDTEARAAPRAQLKGLNRE